MHKLDGESIGVDVPRRVLLVGDSSPIGTAIAERFHRDGALVTGASPDSFTHPAVDRHVVTDCTIGEQAQNAVQTAVATDGSLDVVVLAAAATQHSAVVDLREDDWDRTVAVTLKSGFLVCRYALPFMAHGASIVAVSSVNAQRAVPGLPAYTAAKAGLEGFVRQLALEYGPLGIRANAVAPGLITRQPVDPSASDGYPLCRSGTPDEVAAVVAFLAGDDSSFITGATVPVDGGLAIASPSAFTQERFRSRFLPPS